MSDGAEPSAGVTQCEEIDCNQEPSVTLINNSTAEEHAYCLDHAEEALQKLSQLNVGSPIGGGLDDE